MVMRVFGIEVGIGLLPRGTPWIVTIIGLAGSVQSGVAQWIGVGSDGSFEVAIARGDSLHFAHDPTAALEIFEAVLGQTPDHVGALWRAARESVQLGVLSHGTEIENRWYARGEGFARRAAAVQSDDVNAQRWLLASLGQRAVQTDAATAARLGTEIYRTAHVMLRQDPDNAEARHALGVLNYEVMKLSSIERFIGSRILGHRVFRLTSWDDAVRYLEETVRMRPECVWCIIDLAKLYLEMDRMENARAEFQRALSLPAVHPADAEFHRQAQSHLRRMQ